LPKKAFRFIAEGMKATSFILCLLWVLLFTSCEEEKPKQENKSDNQSAFSRIERIKELETDVEVMKWENVRLSLKVRTVDGSALVRDKRTNLWHHDVEFEPFTGRAVEEFEPGKPRAEAHFLKGKKDGMERFWYENGILKEEGQWFNNQANGMMRAWDDKGRLTKAVRYKNGELIEVLRQ
jgi:hypothetical protein